MKTKQTKKSLLPWLTAAAVLVSASFPVQSVLAGPPIPSKKTVDTVSARVGVFQGGSTYTADAAGHSGAPGDYAVDFPVVGGGAVYVQDGSLFNTAAAKDEVTVSFWAQKYENNDSSAFWADSPSSNNGQRGYQAHVPWSNGNIYFDSVGCCGANQRLQASITTFPPYQAVGDPSWWNDWHFYVFSKKAGDKQIWIDGQLFLEQLDGAAALPKDFTDLYIGAIGAGSGLFHGVMDDFSVWSTQLSEADMNSLVSGTLPTALPPAAGLLGYWNFNDFEVEKTLFKSILPVPDTKSAAPNLIQVVHTDGATPWEQNNVSLKVDGLAVVATVVKDVDTATVSFVPTPLFAAKSTHTAVLTYPSGGQQVTGEWTFTVSEYTPDSVAAIPGVLTGGVSHTGNTGGHSGTVGDYGIDFGANGTGPIVVSEVGFLNDAAAADEMTFMFWAKKYNNNDSSAFWALSPSSNNGQRGYQAHVPWSNGHIYFDTAGCCNADQRIERGVDAGSVPEYVDATWWNDWHLYVFSKKADLKQIWIDGQLFHEGTGAAPLPLDFTKLMIGSDSGGGARMHAVIDDFAVFSTQLTQDDMSAILGGTKPSALPASVGLVAYWPFDDGDPAGRFLPFIPAPDAINAAPNLVKVEYLDGTIPWNLAKVCLWINDVKVGADISRANGKVTVKYVPSPIFPAKSTQKVHLTYPGVGDVLLGKDWQFTVADYKATKDVLHQYAGILEGAAAFTPDAGGHSGNAGDYAMDFGPNQAGQSVHILDASFLNEAAANDEMAVAGWQKLYSIHDSAFFWGISPSSNGSTRGWGTHAPWSNNNLYFDTAGCCGGDQRTSAPITGLPTYTGDLTWWNDWHYFVFQKKLDAKEIWIDGQLLIAGSNIKPLPTDFTEGYLGFDPPDNARMQGILDDFAVFKTALDATTISDLVSGVLPTALPASAGLIAYWNFNDPPAIPIHIDRIVRDGASLTITWSGGTAPYLLERKEKLSDANWVEIANTSSLSATVPLLRLTGFYRVRNP